MSLTKLSHCFEFLCEGWRLYFCHLYPGKMPFNDLLPLTALEADVPRIWLHLSRACASLLPFSIPLSPQQAHARAFGLLLQVLSWSVPMLPSALVSGSHWDPRRQLNIINSPLWPSLRVSLILTIFRSRFICNCYRPVFFKSWERMREEGECITVIHGRFAGLILK